jgi:hypothetical protein
LFITCKSFKAVFLATADKISVAVTLFKEQLHKLTAFSPPTLDNKAIHVKEQKKTITNRTKHKTNNQNIKPKQYLNVIYIKHKKKQT